MSPETRRRLQRRLWGELGEGGRRRSAGWPLLAACLVVAGFGLARLREAPPAAPGARLDCVVDAVFDGDSVRLSCPGGRRTVRLWGIDAPEDGQAPWGGRAREALRARLADDTAVALEVRDIDVYGRSVGRLWLADGEDLGLALVRDGAAAVYARYNDDPAYSAAEAEARAARRGIWAEPGAQRTPWLWRRLNPREP